MAGDLGVAPGGIAVGQAQVAVAAAADDQAAVGRDLHRRTRRKEQQRRINQRHGLFHVGSWRTRLYRTWQALIPGGISA